VINSGAGERSCAAAGTRATRVGLLAALLATVLGAAPAADAHSVLAERGWTGASYIPDRGVCKFRVGGVLQVGTNPPTVTGPNLRRRRRDLTRARYAVWFMRGNGEVLDASNWSGWIRVSDRGWSTWNGFTAFNGDWRNNYLLDFRIEWWKRGRRKGWRAYRMETYNYWDQYNIGPYGPFSSCAAW
jgi:hypothetical protein